MRYPNEIAVDENQARVAIDYAAKVKDWARAVITTQDASCDGENNDVNNKGNDDVT